MPVYNFKSISAVPTSPDLIDIVLTRTQRRTPTVIHPGYKITRIRSFYIRKIKFTQQTISERLSNILTEFPRLDDIHPFYSDLCNTLYDRDHYKLALGQLNTARGLVDAIARDLIRMVKHGDSLYRCKCLKRAALGRMCTILKRQKSSLAYLEEVRKHLSRFPALDPTTRTLLMCGCPNVGKSSFMNKITRANVDVQPYAFTTKSLFVGHADYRYLRWQVIDTPGLLDQKLEYRNTIEMQAITALAHLTCSVLYFVDISENCGYTIEQQCSLFWSIRPLFANKELIVVVNKIDICPWETLEADKKKLVEDLAASSENITLMTMSNTSEHNISAVKNLACDKLLATRVENRLNTSKVSTVMNRLQVFTPLPRDDVVRDASIPASVLEARDSMDKDKPKKSRVGYAPTKNDVTDDDSDAEMGDTTAKKTARELMWENGGPGVWAPDYRDVYDLAEDSQKYDAIPQILNGKNIADYIDPEIEAKLAALEAEEEQLVAELGAVIDDESDLEEEEEAAVTAIREKKTVMRQRSRFNRGQNKSVMPRHVRGRAKDMHDSGALNKDTIVQTLGDVGVDATKMIENRARAPKRGRSVSRRSEAVTPDDTDMADTSLSKGSLKKLKKSRSQSIKREHSLARSHSKPRDPSASGLRDEAMVSKAKAKEMIGIKKWSFGGRSGEGDRTQSVHLVKWMNTGKKRNGTTYCR